MNEKKFDPKKLKKLNNPERLKDIPPEYILSRINVADPKIMVEIGAGTAFFSKVFQGLFPGSVMYASDLSQTMLDWIKENVTPENPDIIPVKSEESAVPLDDNLADLVFMITLHHELENPLLMLKEAYRMLKPGGAIFIVDWAKKEMDQGPPMKIRVLPGDVAAQLTQAGFENIRAYDEDMPKHFLVVGEKP